MSFSEELLDDAVRQLKDEAIELVPLAISALRGLVHGEPPERVLSKLEREALAKYAQKRLDAALERGRGGR